MGFLSNPELPDLRDGNRGERGEEVRVKLFPSRIAAREGEFTVRARERAP